MRRFAWVNLVLVLAVLALAVVPLAFGLGSGAEPFSGADALAGTGFSIPLPELFAAARW